MSLASRPRKGFVSETELDEITKSNMVRTVLVGDYNAGKSSLIQRLAKDEFHDGNKVTIGLDFQLIRLPGIGTLQLWDSGGRERFGSSLASRRFHAAAEVVVVCFDVTKQRSLDVAIEYVKESKKLRTDPVMKTFLIGCKCDLLDDPKTRAEIDENDLEMICMEEKILYLRTSAKSKEGCEKLLSLLHESVALGPTAYHRDMQLKREAKSKKILALETEESKGICRIC